MELNLQMVKEFIESSKDSNEEVKNYIGGFITSDRVEEFLNNEDGKKLLQPKLDKYHQKSLESWRQNNWEKELDAEIRKRFPAKSESEIELEKIKTQLKQMELEKTKESLTNKAIKVANEKKIPLDLIDFIIGNDEDNTLKNIEKLEGILNVHIQSAVEERLKSTGSYTPPSGGGGKGLTKEDFTKMSYKERIELNQKNPELYKQLSK